ncbi:MAG: cation:proton antiporter [Bacteroidales bacterium]|nr:cation:proton antiporter [Bacteroidales bacterium]
MEDLHLVTDLALILISAGITTIVFKALKQPLVLGYIVAGFLVGPHFNLFPTIMEQAVISEWSEIGIIFLLFALGLEFSFKRLFQVGSTAFTTAGVEIITVFLAGFMTGYLLGWTTIESVFLGGMLAMSSTTIVIKAFADMGVKKQKFADITLVVLIIQDLVAILMMVLLPSIAAHSGVGGKDLLMSIVKLVFFIILWFLIGIYVFPSFFKKGKKLINEETLLIISIGLCFGMVALATSLGFSSALGAFVMGSILGETVEGHRIEKLMKGTKDIFGAIFFVSVGMMVDPQILVSYWLPILILSLVTIFVKSSMTALGVLLSGESLKVAVQTGMSLSQIGEFAFIIATLGNSLGVMDAYIYPVIVAVSVITTFTTPYCIRFAEPIATWMEERMPARWKARLALHQGRSHTVNQESEWRTLLKTYLKKILIYGVILAAILLASFQWLSPFVWKHLGEEFSPFLIGCINAGVTLIAMAPFLRGLLNQNRQSGQIYFRLWNNGRFNRSGLIALVLLKVFMVFFFVSSVLFKHFKYSPWIILLFAVAIFFFIAFSEKTLRRYSRIESHFQSNLNAKETLAQKENPLEYSYNKRFAGNDIHLEGIRVSADSPYVGKTLAESDFRRKYGINIVKIKRGSHAITLPSPDEHIYPNDKLLVLGSDQQLEDFMKDIQYMDVEAQQNAYVKNVGFYSFVVEPDFPFLQKTLKETNVRELGFMVIGIERQGSMLMNPQASTTFELDDVVWVAGERKHMPRLLGKEKL